MKLKAFYNKMYEKVFSVKFFKLFLKIPGVEKLLEYEVISYLFFGVMTTVVNFAVTALANGLAGSDYSSLILFNIGGFGFRWTYAVQAIAWVASVLFAFVTNKLFVFDSRSNKLRDVLREIASFFGARIVSFVIFEELFFALVEKLFSGSTSSSAAFWMAKCISGVAVIIFNYIASKLVIFKKKNSGEGG